MNKGKRRKVGFAPGFFGSVEDGPPIETDGETSGKIPEGTSGGQIWCRDNIWERLNEKIKMGESIKGEKF